MTSDLVREENTMLDLVLILFRNSFDLYHIKENIKELEELEGKYNKDKIKEDRRIKYLKILNSIKDKLELKEKKVKRRNRDKNTTPDVHH